MVSVVDEVAARSTEACRAYVLAARARLNAELTRFGDAARERRSFQRLAASITASELARTWPAADLDVVLAGADADPAPGGTTTDDHRSPA